MFDIRKVGEQITLLRKEKELTQEKLAEALNVSPQAVSKWENGHTLPETTLLPLLAKLLDCSIDTILLPNELQILDAICTDGYSSFNITSRINKLIDNNKIDIPVTQQTLLQHEDSGRLWFLFIKYKNNSGTFYVYTKEGSNLALNSESTGFTFMQKEMNIIDAYYGNSECSYNVMHKIDHYKFLNWGRYHVNHETFPSNPATSKTEYLSVLYMNENGLHLSVCEEGEYIVYTKDRKDLYREPFFADAKVIQGVEQLQWGKQMECSWAGSLTVALRAMGEETTYEKVMGVSGACYRLAFSHPAWDYSSVDGLVVYDYATPGYKAFGYEPKFADRVDKKHREDERNNIVKSLNNNKPVLAINLRVAPEWGVITGYQDEGMTFLCRTYYDREIIEKELGSVDQYLKADNWPFIITHFGGKTTPPSDKDNLVNSLKVMIDCNNINSNRGYYMGYEAYKVWRDALRNDDFFNIDYTAFDRLLDVNIFCMLSLVDARRCAYEYLYTSSELFDGIQRFVLLDISNKYKEIHESLNNMFSILNDWAINKKINSRKFFTQKLRYKQADILDKVMELEKQAETLAKEFLSYNEKNMWQKPE